MPADVDFAKSGIIVARDVHFQASGVTSGEELLTRNGGTANPFDVIARLFGATIRPFVITAKYFVIIAWAFGLTASPFGLIAEELDVATKGVGCSRERCQALW